MSFQSQCKQHRLPHFFLTFQSIPLYILKAGSCSLFLPQIRVEHLKRGRFSLRVEELSLLRSFPPPCWSVIVWFAFGHFLLNSYNDSISPAVVSFCF